MKLVLHKIKMFSPGIIISMFGLIGMLVAFSDPTPNMGSRVPVIMFFLMVTIIGVILQVIPQDMLEDTFGEVPEKREFG